MLDDTVTLNAKRHLQRLLAAPLAVTHDCILPTQGMALGQLPSHLMWVLVSVDYNVDQEAAVINMRTDICPCRESLVSDLARWGFRSLSLGVSHFLSHSSCVWGTAGPSVSDSVCHLQIHKLCVIELVLTRQD